ncbi:MAG: Calx-beta domain-containing protein, partial [Isosphaeraceae bacterium]
GVQVDSGSQNTIRNNSIYDNRGRGISLNTSNNANLNQPAPVITSLDPQGSKVTVRGTLSAATSTSYDLEFFANPDKGASGNGQIQPYQGRRYLGKATVNTDAAGNATFSYDVPTFVSSGEWVTATATDPAGNTSEISNAVRVPTHLQFASVSYAVNESEGAIVVTVTRTGGLGGDVSVAYATSDGTATAGNQYAAANGTLFFLSNDTLPRTFSVPILDTPNIGGSTTFLVTLSDPTNGATLGTPATTTITIHDDDTGLKFSAPTATANEADGTVTVTVTRPSGVGTASVNYATANGTALAGVNYVAKSGTIQFAAGEFSKPITISLIGDNAVTGSLTFSVGLSNPVGALIEPPGTILVTVGDADSPGALGFSTTSYVVQPGATTATVTVKRTGGKGGLVSVGYATGGGTAVPGVDYTPKSGVLTFGPGELTKSFNVAILNGNANATTSQFVVTLSNPTGGATLGSIATANVKVKRGTAPVGPGNPGTPIGDVVPPTVVSVTPVSGFGGVTSIVIGFSEPLDLVRAQNISNYGSFATSFGRDNIPHTRDDSNVAIIAATYDAASRKVTLRLASPLSPSLRYYVNLNRDAVSSGGRGISDLAGNLLAGDGRNAGTPHLVTIGTTTTTTTNPRIVTSPTPTRGRTSIVRRGTVSASAVDSLSTRGSLPRTGTLTSWARRR